MNSKVQIIQTSQFVELVAVPLAQSTNTTFDIIIETETTLQNYCEALANKVFCLHQSQFSDFINYQCTKVDNALTWVNKFEKLISNNEKLFAKKCAFTRVSKLINLLELKRKELQSSRVEESKSKTPKHLINAESDDRIFSFYEVKKHIESLQLYSEKVIYLTDEICEFKQAEIASTNNRLLDFKKQCKTLLKRIENDKLLKSKLEKEQLENSLNQNSELKPVFKIRINGPINILTDVYKQMMYSSKSSGKSYINHSIKDITKFICDNHLDEQGNELSQHTIRTYLSPTRSDKDPNNDNKIRL